LPVSNSKGCRLKYCPHEHKSSAGRMGDVAGPLHAPENCCLAEFDPDAVIACATRAVLNIGWHLIHDGVHGVTLTLPQACQ
jgi:hypothetical protein